MKPYIGGTPGLRVHRRTKHDAQVVTAIGAVTTQTVSWLRDCLLNTIHQGDPDTIVDLHAVTTIDAVGIEALRRTGLRANALGGQLRVLTDHDQHRQLRAAGLAAVASLHPDLDHALAARCAAPEHWSPPTFRPAPRSVRGLSSAPDPRGRPGPVAPTNRPPS